MRIQFLSLFVILVALMLFIPVTQAKENNKPDFTAVYGDGDSVLRVATGSPGALGLLKELAIPFCQANDCRIKWLKRGSGASLEALHNGLVDIVMVHAPKAERQAIEQGWATGRTLLGRNQFYIVGPPSDPAEIRTAESAPEAFKRIAEAGEDFLSRADNSGTHKKEMHIWQQAGITPDGSWYIKTHDFMGPTLMQAEEVPGYFMTDSSTFVVKKPRLDNLTVLFKDDPMLINVYHALMANPLKYSDTNDALARKFLRFVGFGPGQNKYRTFGIEKYGEPLYKDAFSAQKFEK